MPAFTVYSCSENFLTDNDDVSDDDNMIHVVANVVLNTETSENLWLCVENTVTNCVNMYTACTKLYRKSSI